MRRACLQCIQSFDGSSGQDAAQRIRAKGNQDGGKCGVLQRQEIPAASQRGVGRARAAPIAMVATENRAASVQSELKRIDAGGSSALVWTGTPINGTAAWTPFSLPGKCARTACTSDDDAGHDQRAVLCAIAPTNRVRACDCGRLRSWSRKNDAKFIFQQGVRLPRAMVATTDCEPHGWMPTGGFPWKGLLLERIRSGATISHDPGVAEFPLGGRCPCAG